MKLTDDQVDKILSKNPDAGDSLTVTFEDVERFGDDDCIREMFTDINKYNRMLKEKITFINEGLTAAIPFTRENLYLICAYSGSGKCFARGTEILMHDGSIKKVEDVVVGDKVMGPDSEPRNVIGLGRGREMMYDVVPTKGDKYTVNASHVLALRNSCRRRTHKGMEPGGPVNISVRDYLALEEGSFLRSTLKGYRSGEVRFPSVPVDLDPYVLGLWLGDGASLDPRIVSADTEVLDHLRGWGRDRGMAVTEYSKLDSPKTILLGFSSVGKSSHNAKGGDYSNPFRGALKRYGLVDNKHIPRDYLVNDRAVRLALLAGIIDSDGCVSRGCTEVCFKSRRLAEDLVFLARSLGFAAYRHEAKKVCCNSKTRAEGLYHRVFLSGDLSEVPTKVARKKLPARKQIKNVLNVGINVREAGVGDYYGFEVDGDHLFLLADFTVAHNSTIAANISYPLWKQGKKSLVISNEESKQDVLFRIGCLERGYNFNDYKKGMMPPDQQREVAVLFQDISRFVKVLDVNYKDGLTTKLEGVKNALESVRTSDYSCAMIDYLQLIQYSVMDPSRGRYDVLNDFRIWLGRYIKNSNIPIVVFAQLHSIGKRQNKDLDSRIKEIPNIIEPSTVILEVIPNFEDKTSDFIIVKDRFGLANTKIICAFDRGRFVALTDEHRQKMLQAKLDRIKSSTPMVGDGK